MDFELTESQQQIVQQKLTVAQDQQLVTADKAALSIRGRITPATPYWRARRLGHSAKCAARDRRREILNLAVAHPLLADQHRG